ncbi:hypothetical protein [Marinigracilibium pacificum]|uniref:DUF4145 domain-containing protein n=1 Tax=Marinigracilibium pacificum TaxID=2729599 RepID=A0A848J0K5_9BACT|nr:hypothetical protein [Marinigracilibium pacificum]NMM47809.1 hypothetical protein [Marinigracilibium pacificum]
MSNLEFIIELIDKLIWPATLLFLFFLLKKPIRELIPFVSKAKFSELELEFDRKMEKIKIEAEMEFENQSPDYKTSLIELAHDMPSSSILEAWKVIESKTEALILKSNPNIDLNKPSRYKLMQDTLEGNHLLETKKIKIFDDLRQIRNKVAHVPDYVVTKEQAINYISIAIKLIDFLDEELKSN